MAASERSFPFERSVSDRVSRRYEHADDTMASLTNHLLEEAGGGGKRGLVLDMPDATVFQLWLSPQFRQAWKSVQQKVLTAALELPDPEADLAARQYAARVEETKGRGRGGPEAQEKRQRRAAELKAQAQTRANRAPPPLGQALLGRGRSRFFGGPTRRAGVLR